MVMTAGNSVIVDVQVPSTPIQTIVVAEDWIKIMNYMLIGTYDSY